MSKTLQGWEPDSLRVTIFFADIPSATEMLNVSDVYSAPLESETTSGPLKQLTTIASFGPGKLIYSAVQNRMDLTWNAEPSETDFASLGASEGALEALLNPLRAWLESGHLQINRIALGGQHLKVVANRDEGYELLSEHMPFRVDSNNSDDVVLQINRKGKADIGEGTVRFNRICRWSVQKFQSTVFIISSDGTPTLSNGSEFLALACNQDFNTPPENPSRPYSGHESSTFLKTFQEDCLKFLEHGDEANTF